MNHGTRHGGPVRKCSAIGQLKAFVRLLDLQCVRGRCVRGRQNWRFSGLGRLPSSAETLGASLARGRAVNADSWGDKCDRKNRGEQLGLTPGLFVAQGMDQPGTARRILGWGRSLRRADRVPRPRDRNGRISRAEGSTAMPSSIDQVARDTKRLRQGCRYASAPLDRVRIRLAPLRS